jgi:type IV fimbrial biogenesis protein FimT
MDHRIGARPPPRRTAGVTLIELMLGLSVGAVLLALAVPSFRQLTASNRAAAVESDIVTALNLARSESVRQGIPVSVCASVDGATCATAGDWGSGWIVFTDDAGTPGVLDPGDEKLQAFSGPGGDVRIIASDATVQYEPPGTAVAPATFSVLWTGCSGTGAHEVRVLGTGLVSVKAVSCPSS